MDPGGDEEGLAREDLGRQLDALDRGVVHAQAAGLADVDSDAASGGREDRAFHLALGVGLAIRDEHNRALGVAGDERQCGL